MSIIELGALGEFMSSVLVLITLVYLTVELAQTKRSINAANFVNATQMFNPVNMATAADADLFELFVRGCNEPESLTDTEASRFHLLLRAYNNNFMTLRLMHDDGSFPRDAWTIYERNYAELLATPGGAALIPSLQFAAPEWSEKLEEMRASIDGPIHFTKEGFQRPEDATQNR